MCNIHQSLLRLINAIIGILVKGNGYTFSGENNFASFVKGNYVLLIESICSPEKNIFLFDIVWTDVDLC